MRAAVCLLLVLVASALAAQSGNFQQYFILISFVCACVAKHLSQFLFTFASN
jgi:hypothetical protein